MGANLIARDGIVIRFHFLLASKRDDIHIDDEDDVVSKDDDCLHP